MSLQYKHDRIVVSQERLGIRCKLPAGDIGSFSSTINHLTGDRLTPVIRGSKQFSYAHEYAHALMEGMEIRRNQQRKLTETCRSRATHSLASLSNSSGGVYDV